MTSIGRITLPLLIFIIGVCEAGMTELNVVVNPKPIFHNRTNLTSEPTPRPMPFTAPEHNQVNEHMKKTLALLNSMTPKQRAQALTAMSTSDSALDQYVCNMISESDRALIRHMNDKLSLIKSIPEDQRPEILAAMLKSNNSADRNLASVIMKNNEQGGDKDGKQLQALNDLGPHDRAELLKRMSKSSFADDRGLAERGLSGGKDGNNKNIPTFPNSNKNASSVVSLAIPTITANAIIPSAASSKARFETSRPAVNVSSIAPSDASRPAVNLSSIPAFEASRPTVNLTSTAQSEVPRPAANSSSIVYSGDSRPAVNLSSAQSEAAGTPTVNLTTTAQSQAPRPAANLSSIAASEAFRPAVNLTSTAQSEALRSAANSSSIVASEASRPAANSTSTAQYETPRPGANNSSSSIAASQASGPAINFTSTAQSATPYPASTGVPLHLNRSISFANGTNKTSLSLNKSLSESPTSIQNATDSRPSRKKPDLKNVAMLWNASNSTDEQDYNLSYRKLDTSGNSLTLNQSNAAAKVSPPSNQSLVIMAAPMNSSKTLNKSPDSDAEIILGAPIPSWLSQENGTSIDAADRTYSDKASAAESADNAFTAESQPWSLLNRIPEQNSTDSVDPGIDAMLTLENSKLTMHHFEEQPESQSQSSTASESVDAAEGNTASGEAETLAFMGSPAPSNSSSGSSEYDLTEEAPADSVSKQTVLIETSPEQSSWFEAIAGYLPSITSYHHSLYADDDAQPILQHLGEAPIPSQAESLSVERLGEAPIPSSLSGQQADADEADAVSDQPDDAAPHQADEAEADVDAAAESDQAEAADDDIMDENSL